MLLLLLYSNQCLDKLVYTDFDHIVRGALSIEFNLSRILSCVNCLLFLVYMCSYTESEGHICNVNKNREFMYSAYRNTPPEVARQQMGTATTNAANIICTFMYSNIL